MACDGGEVRVEKDSMGEMRVPASAYYGAQTQRAVENFPISGLRLPRAMIGALGTIKLAAALANKRLGLLDEQLAEVIVQAAEEVEDGKLDSQFVVDVFQTGSGTSSNMNANEVIASRAKELLSAKGTCDIKLHPNDHVNMSQSSNDVIPTAIHVAAALDIQRKLVPALKLLADSLGRKEREFADIVKTGRTHLQDATPITLGQEFSGYKSQIEHGIGRVQRSLASLRELALGGTAVGTGINTHPEFARTVIEEISTRVGFVFEEAENHFEAQAAKDAIVEMSGQLRVIACSLTKIANDIRWLACGPRCGFGELILPEVQPGSSIMPGKVNPVIAESVLMVCAQVMGNDLTVSIGGQNGNFELNVMMPVMALNILQSIELLANAARNFGTCCVDGIDANRERINELAELSIAICTSLAPKIGYNEAAALAKEAFKNGETIRDAAMRKAVLPKDELDRLLDLKAMTKPGL